MPKKSLIHIENIKKKLRGAISLAVTVNTTSFIQVFDVKYVSK